MYTPGKHPGQGPPRLLGAKVIQAEEEPGDMAPENTPLGSPISPSEGLSEKPTLMVKNRPLKGSPIGAVPVVVRVPRLIISGAVKPFRSNVPVAPVKVSVTAPLRSRKSRSH